MLSGHFLLLFKYFVMRKLWWAERDVSSFLFSWLMLMCNCVYPARMDGASQHSWAEQKHVKLSNSVNLWRIFDVLTCNCSSFHPPPQSYIRSLGSEHSGCVFSLLGRLFWERCSCLPLPLLACWTGLSGGSAEDRAGACFNNACVLEATSGQGPFLKRRFEDTPRPTHVQEPIKNRKSGRTKQHASAEGLQGPGPVINKQGTSHMHLLSRCSHMTMNCKVWIWNRNFIKLSPLFFPHG